MATRKIWMAVVFLLFAVTSFAQTLNPKVQPSTGGYLTGGNLQLQFTIGEPLISTFTAGGNEFSLGFEQPEINIVTGSISTGPFCAGSQIRVPFKATGIYAHNNVFTVQLSDSSGSFASAVLIGTDTTTHSDTISATIPFTVTGGTHYKVRILASGPVFVGRVSANFTINSIGLPIGISSQRVCSDTAVTFTFDSIIAGSGGNQIEWATDSIFSGAHFIASGGSFSLTIVVGADSVLWVRSKDSVNQCVGASLSVALYAIIMPPDTLQPLIASSNSALTFLFSNVVAGCGGNQIEWSTDSTFISSAILASGGNIYLGVNSGSDTILWYRSRNSFTGLVSSSRHTNAKVLKQKPGPDPSNFINVYDVTDAGNFSCGGPNYSCTGSTYTFSWYATNYPTSGDYQWTVVKDVNGLRTSYYSVTGTISNSDISIILTFPDVGYYEIFLSVPDLHIPMEATVSIYGQNSFTASQVTNPSPIDPTWVPNCNDVFISTNYISVPCDCIGCTEESCAHANAAPPTQELDVDWGDGNSGYYIQNGTTNSIRFGSFSEFPGYLFHTYANPGIYTVTMTSQAVAPGHLQCFTASVLQIQVWAGPPQVSLSASNNPVCSNLGITAVTIQSNIAANAYHVSSDAIYSYHWSASDGSDVSNITTSDITVSPTATTTYSVTVTEENTATSITCSGTASITININDNCCQGDPMTVGTTTPTYTFTPAANTPSLRSIYDAYPALRSPASPIQVALNGTFPVAVITDISQDVAFSNITFIMGRNSGIDVGNGQNLYLYGCTLQGCNYMWNNITVENGGLLNMWPITTPATPSTLEDAMNGIVLIDGGAMYVPGTNFYRNQKSILISNSVINLVNYNISGCTFGMGGFTSMLPAPNGNNYTHPLCGIELLLGSNFVLPNPQDGAPNTFEHMNCGVKLNEFSAQIYNNKFNYISNYEQGADLSFGSAVYANSNGGQNTIPFTLLVNTMSIHSATAFFHCGYAIRANNIMNVDVQHNWMEVVDNGVYTTNCLGNANISSNWILTTQKGITLNSNSTLTQNVGFNTIAVIEPYQVTTHTWGQPVTSWYATYGVSEKESSPNAVGANIFGNSILGGQHCIELYSAKNAQVFANKLYQNGTTAVGGIQTGIFATHCSGINIQSNAITGNGTEFDIQQPSNYNPGSVYSKTGIYISTNSTGSVCSNVLGSVATADQGLGYGLFFVGNCQSVQVVNNTANYSTYGLVQQKLGATSVLGDQGTSELINNNVFSGPFTNTASPVQRSYSFNRHPFNPPTFYISGVGNPDDPTPTGETSLIVSEKIQSLPAFTDAPSANCIPLNLTGIQIRFGAMHRAFYEAVARGYADTLMDTGYTATGPWLVQRELYDNLTDSVIRFNLNTLPAGLDTMISAYIDTATDSNIVAGLADLLGELISGKPSSYPVDSSALTDTVLTNFYAANQTSDFNAIQAYAAQVKALSDTAVRSDTALYNSAWSASYSLNEAIPEANTQALNFKQVQRIYLKIRSLTDTIGIDSIDLAILGNLALQCPYIAGDAVFYARALYAQITDTVFYDDLQLCQPDTGHSGRMLLVSSPLQDTTNTTSTLEFVKLYPNPAKQLINLVFYAATMGEVDFEIFDQLGVVVLTDKLGTRTHTQYATNPMSNGIYYWRLRDGQRIIKTGKIAIMK